jgi:hypothetical protein
MATPSHKFLLDETIRRPWDKRKEEKELGAGDEKGQRDEG